MEITAQETSALYVCVHRERVAPTRLRANGHAQDHHPRHCHNVPRRRFRVTGVARTPNSPIGETISARPVVHPLTTGSLTARVVPAT